LPEKALQKQIMSIQTDSVSLDDPKDPEKCNIFTLYSLLAPVRSINELRNKYINGGMGYGYVKQLLFELILDKFSEERQKFDYYHQHPEEVNIELSKGAEKARMVAKEVLLRVRKKIGY